MPKGYVIARAAVRDMTKWSEYLAKSKVACDRFGGFPIARGGRHEVVEGEGRPRNVILEFPSYEAAMGYITSLEYRQAREARLGAGDIDIVVVEGV